jgi:hypothetical protein
MKKFLINALCAYFCAWLIIFPTLAHGADPQPIEAGDPAPFSGVLFATEDAARLLVNLEQQETACQARIDFAISEAIAAKNLLLNTCNSNLEIRTEMYELQLAGYRDYSDFLEKKAVSPGLPREWVLVIGILAGVGVTIGAGVAMNQAAGQ